MPGLRYILWRLLQLIPVLIGISIVSFLLVKLSPGDPIRLMPREVAGVHRERTGIQAASPADASRRSAGEESGSREGRERYRYSERIGGR